MRRTRLSDEHNRSRPLYNAERGSYKDEIVVWSFIIFCAGLLAYAGARQGLEYYKVSGLGVVRSLHISRHILNDRPRSLGSATGWLAEVGDMKRACLDLRT